MKITRYGITLKRLTVDQIELVRKWRNSEKISRFMLYREHITPEMQKAWFKKIDNYENFYFLIEYCNENIGLIDIASIDWQAKSAYAGLFIYDEKYWGTSAPVLASLCMLDVFFIALGLQNISAKVKKGNKAAMQYNRELGFELSDKQHGQEGIELSLTPQLYFKKSQRLRSIAKNIKGDDTIIEFQPGQFSGDSQIIEQVQNLSDEKCEELRLQLVSLAH
jgi:RimJ/RimL family protein N-acetyltransferase